MNLKSFIKIILIVLGVGGFPNVVLAHNQVVAGLSISCSDEIQYNQSRSKSFWAKIPPNIKNQLNSYEIYESKDFEIRKTIFKPGIPYNLDVGANGAIENELALRKTFNVNKLISPVKISGIDARRISLTYDVSAGKMATETLLVFDPASGGLWMITFALAKNKPLNPFSDYNLDAERAEASKILNSVKLIND